MLAGILLTSACAQGSARADVSLEPDDLVLQIEDIGGYVSTTSLATRLPVVSVYADMTTTRFVVITGDSRDELDVYALEQAVADNLNPDQQAARAELSRLRAAMTDLPRTLGAQSVTAAQPYQPTSVAAIAEPWTDPGPEYGPLTDVPWPGPELPGQPLPSASEVSCLDVTGDEADAALQAGASASAATPWTSGGQRWTIALRPLLPDERGCNELQLSW